MIKGNYVDDQCGLKLAIGGLVVVEIFAKVPYSQHYYDILDVWTRRVWVWIGLRIMVAEAMVVLWEG